MTLKEKLEVIKNYDDQDPHQTFMTIAEEFAIEFAYFVGENTYSSYADGTFSNVLVDKNLTIKELLEIFKKEKGYE